MSEFQERHEVGPWAGGGFGGGFGVARGRQSGCCCFGVGRSRLDKGMAWGSPSALLPSWWCHRRVGACPTCPSSSAGGSGAASPTAAGSTELFGMEPRWTWDRSCWVTR